MSRPGGSRRLGGPDGLAVEAEPGLYGIDARTMATIDAAVPPHAVVHLPPRQQPTSGLATAPQTGGTASRPTTGARTPTRRHRAVHRGWLSS
ncbi:hypothetical protein ACFWN1_23425 [Streptomyces sp. NPDC058459]|uniref:hypothetical protein n=1 Tax=Streptomyces sp. NPDC058459 TaxID=3346508 RepID=UPI00366457B9